MQLYVCDFFQKLPHSRPPASRYAPEQRSQPQQHDRHRGGCGQGLRLPGKGMNPIFSINHGPES
jgi:hypothetical protein